MKTYKVTRKLNEETGKKEFKVETGETNFKEWIGNRRDAFEELGKNLKAKAKDPETKQLVKNVLKALGTVVVIYLAAKYIIPTAITIVAYLMMTMVFMAAIMHLAEALEALICKMRSKDACPAAA